MSALTRKSFEAVATTPTRKMIALLIENGIREALGADLHDGLMAHLGPEAALCLSWPGRALIPDGALLLRVRNRKKVERLLENAAQHLGKAAPLTEFDHRGHRIRYVEAAALGSVLGIDGFPPLKPAWAFVGEYLVFGLWPQSVKRLVTHVVYGGPRLAAHPDFARLRARLERERPEGAVLAGIAWIDLPRMTGFLMDSLTPVLQTFLPAEVPLNVAELPSSETVTQHLSGAMALTWSASDALSIDMYSPGGILFSGAALTAGVGFITWRIAIEAVIGALNR